MINKYGKYRFRLNEDGERDGMPMSPDGGDCSHMSASDVIAESVRTIESFKLKAKGLHWAAEDDKIHTLCDELYEDLDKAQDKIAEIYMGWRSVKFPSDYLSGVEASDKGDYESLVTEIADHAVGVIGVISRIIEWSGAKTVYEGLLAKMQQGKYRQTQR